MAFADLLEPGERNGEGSYALFLQAFHPAGDRVRWYDPLAGDGGWTAAARRPRPGKVCQQEGYAAANLLASQNGTAPGFYFTNS